MKRGRTRKAITFAFYFPRLDVSGARAKTKTKMPVTLALIKPEALKNGYAPAIEATIEAQKFSIVARAQVTLTPPQAAELYEEFAGTALFAAMCAARSSRLRSIRRTRRRPGLS